MKFKQRYDSIVGLTVYEKNIGPATPANVKKAEAMAKKLHCNAAIDANNIVFLYSWRKKDVQTKNRR